MVRIPLKYRCWLVWLAAVPGLSMHRLCPPSLQVGRPGRQTQLAALLAEAAMGCDPSREEAFVYATSAAVWGCLPDCKVPSVNGVALLLCSWDCGYSKGGQSLVGRAVRFASLQSSFQVSLSPLCSDHLIRPEAPAETLHCDRLWKAFLSAAHSA